MNKHKHSKHGKKKSKNLTKKNNVKQVASTSNTQIYESNRAADNNDIKSPARGNEVINIKTPVSFIPTTGKNIDEEKTRHKRALHHIEHSAGRKRKEIKISLVEGMVYDEAGKDMSPDDMGSAKYLELNFRKRDINELDETKGNMSNDMSMRTYKYRNLHSDEGQESDSDYVARFIEQTAAITGVVIKQYQSYQGESPLK